MDKKRVKKKMINKKEAIQLIKELKKYDENNTKQSRVINEYHKKQKKIDYSSDKYHSICTIPFQKKRKALDNKFKKLGIVFMCADYGDEYCLCHHGLIVTLNALFKINEKDLK